MATTPTMLSARRDELAAPGSPVPAFSPASSFRPACWPPSQEGGAQVSENYITSAWEIWLENYEAWKQKKPLPTLCDPKEGY